MGMREDLPDSPSISWIRSIGHLYGCHEWEDRIDREAKAMKRWEESEERLVLLEWYECERSLNIREEILMREDNGFREGFTPRCEEYYRFFMCLWKEKKSLLHDGSELGREGDISNDILDKYHLRFEHRKPWRTNLLIELPTREDRIESCEAHTVSEGLLPYRPVEHHGNLACEIGPDEEE